MTNERLAPNERKNPQVSAQEWDQVIEHAPYIFDRARWYYGQALGRTVQLMGDPFKGGWIAKGFFHGREATDLIEETFAGVLERTAVAFGQYDSTRAQVDTYIDRVVKYTIQREIQYWLATSTRETNAEDVDLFFVSLDDESAPAGTIDQDRDERLATPEPEVDEFDLEAANAVLTEAKIRASMTDREFYVLRRRADGSSWGAIGDDLGIASRGSVQVMYDRARKKAAAALEEVNEG